MPRIAIDTSKGQYTNTDEFASGMPGQIVNLLVDEHGTLTSRPGLSQFCLTTTDSTGYAGSTDQSIIGLKAYLNKLVAVTAHRRLKIISSDGTGYDISTPYLAGSQTPTFLEDDDGSLIIFGGGSPIRIDQTFTATELTTTLAAAPTHGGIVDRILLVNDVGTDNVYFSDVFNHRDFAIVDPLTRSTPGVLRAGTRFDAVTAVAALRNRILLFGTKSVEAFYGTGLGGGGTNFPFRLEDDPMQSSLGAPFSLVEVDDTLWWIDSSRRLVKLEGRSAAAKSLPVEAQLQALSTYSDCVAHLCEMQGHHLILLHFASVGLTLVYDYVRNIWSEWRKWSTTTGDWTEMPLKAYAYQPEWNKHFCAGDTTGYVYELSPTTYRDAGGPLVRLWRGPFTDAGDMSMKFARRMQFLLDGGTAQSHTSTNEGYNPEIEVRWRNEDREWQDWQTLNAGLVGQYHCVHDLWCRTTFRRQQIEWRCSAPVPLRVNRIELEATPRTR